MFVSKRKKNTYCGSFLDVESAIDAYSKEKTRHIHQLAEEYYAKGQLSEKAFYALMKYNYADRYKSDHFRFSPELTDKLKGE